MSGTVIAGRYELNNIIGTGGFSVVYKARQLGLDRAVAIKLMLKDRMAIVPSLFEHEALVASRINHPNAVATLDFGLTTEGIPFLVMECLQGSPLSQLMDEGAMPIDRAGRLMTQVLGAVGAAHECGVVHRDLKCENVIVEQLRAHEEFVKVIDFGIAHVTGAKNPDLGIVGTPEYMAPEQIRNEEITPATDIYAIGIMMYELIVGRTPFAGSNLTEILTRHLEEAPTPPKNLVTRCPDGLSELILDALQKDARLRPQSASEFQERLLKTLETKEHVNCPGCQLPQLQGERFCTACGVRLSSAPRGTLMGLGDAAANALINRKSPPKAHENDPLFERSNELGKVLSFVHGSGSSALVVFGPQNIGKKHLIQAAIREATSDRVAFVVGPDPSGLRESWYPIMSLLSASLEFPRTVTTDDISSAVAKFGLPARDVPGLCEVFDVPGPLESAEIAVRQREAMAAARRAIDAIDVRYPGALLCFHDLDRYDDPSLRLLRSLVETFDGSGVRLLMSAVSSSVIPVGAEVIRLKGVSDAAITDIVEGIVGRPLEPAELREIATRCDGNAGAAQGLGYWLREGGLVERCPQSVIDILSMRVSRLPSEERKTLQAIAVTGMRIALEHLKQLLGFDCERALGGLFSGGYAHIQNDEVVITSELSELVLEATPAEARRQLHADALKLPGLSPLRLGHHATGAYEHRLAYESYLVAGDTAVRRFDDLAATRCYGTAMRGARAILAAGDVEDGTALFATAAVCLADTQRFVGEYSLAKSVLDEAEELDWNKLFTSRLTRSRARVLAGAGDLEAARKMYERCIALAMRSGDRNFLCESYIDLAGVLGDLRDYVNASKELSEALDIVTLGSDLKDVTGVRKLWLLGFRLAEILLNAGALEKAERLALQSLEQARQSPSKQAPGRVLALLARIADERGSAESASKYRSQAIDELRVVGDRRSTALLLLENARATLQAAPFSSSERKDTRLRAEVEKSTAMELAREVTGTSHTSFTPLERLKPTRPRLDTDAD